MQSERLISSLALSVFVVASATPLFAGELFPIDHGRYVESRIDCGETKRSLLFIYNGQNIKSEKSSCTVSNVSNSGNIYEFDETCSYYHHWWSILPTIVTEYKSRMEISNKREFLLKRENESLEMTDRYRWCASE